MSKSKNTFRELLQEQIEFSLKTFGEGDAIDRRCGLIDHIKKELDEIECQPMDLEEWIDVAILAFDGAWRTGASPCEIISAYRSKIEKNKNRRWPDWKTAQPGKAICHIKENDLIKGDGDA